MEFSERLQEALKLRGWSQTDLANALSITPQAVQKWLNGGYPRMNRLKAIAEKIDVSEEWLITGVGSPFRDRKMRQEMEKELNEIISELSDLNISSLLYSARRLNKR